LQEQFSFIQLQLASSFQTTSIFQLLQTGLKSNFNGFVQNQKTGSKRHLACPRPKTIMYTPREEKMCRRDKQCGDGMRCCAWFDKKHCLKGLSKTPRQGEGVFLIIYHIMLYHIISYIISLYILNCCFYMFTAHLRFGNCMIVMYNLHLPPTQDYGGQR